jgi:hypothetical protein
MASKAITLDEARRREQGERLRFAREAAGYRSARAAALENHWPESTVRAHEAGTRKIGDDDADRYAKRYRANGANVTGKFILYGDKPELESMPSAAASPARRPRPSDLSPEFVDAVAEAFQTTPERLTRLLETLDEIDLLNADPRFHESGAEERQMLVRITAQKNSQKS